MYGYNNGTEIIKAIFKNIDNEWIIKILIPTVTVIDIIFEFFFQSVGAIYFLIILYLIDFLTGVLKSIMYSLKIREYKKKGIEITKELQNKKLTSKKFPRFLLTLLAALILLSVCKFAAIHSIIFTPLYSIFYSVFVGQNIISICENGVEMKILPSKILEVIKKKLTDFKKTSKN